MPEPRRRNKAPAQAGVEELSTADCWRYIQNQALGRLALDRIDGAPDLVPLNYLVFNGTIVMRSAPGGKLTSIDAHPSVAFEVDGDDDTHRWSVVIRGEAARMTDRADLEASGAFNLASMNPTRKHYFIRLIPRSTTGRRFPKTATPAPPAPDVPAAVDVQTSPIEKPKPIPHFAPPPPQSPQRGSAGSPDR